jgi:hypothetical protein
MSTPTIPEHFPDTWDRSWVSALQTADSRLVPNATPDTLTGDRKWYNIGGTVTYKRKTARYPETTYVDYNTSKSWMTPEEWDAPILQDEWDDEFLDSIVVPTSRIMQDQAAAYNRLRDEYVRDAIQGDRTTGESGGTTETFPTANVVAADFGGSDEGITWGKITEAGRLMDDLRVPIEQRCFAIAAEQKQELMSIAQATDKDYANTVLVRNGTIHGTFWAGFTWVQYEDLTYDPSDLNDRHCLAFYKPDIILGESQMKTHMDILPQMSHALQIRPSVKLGSCRINNSSIIVKCSEGV